jgi:hypothetical protein
MTIRIASSRLWLVIAAGALLFGQGCTLEGEGPDVSEYQDVMPEPASVKVAGPETIEASGTSSTQADGAGAANYAHWYQFTRSVREQLNKVSSRVIGSVSFVVHTKVTTTGEGFAEWGPFTLPKDTVTWRLHIERAGNATYEYRLDGRPKVATSESDFVTVLSGITYAVGDERHGDGQFTIDIDAARMLEPDKYMDQSGKAIFTHDLIQAGQRSVLVDYDPGDESRLSLSSQANADGTGQFDITGLADTDAFGSIGLTQLEDFTLSSRWRGDGAGRAEIVIAAGDVSPIGGSVTIAECWGSDFSRVYYADSLGLQPAAGDPTACAMQSTQ